MGTRAPFPKPRSRRSMTHHRQRTAVRTRPGRPQPGPIALGSNHAGHPIPSTISRRVSACTPGVSYPGLGGRGSKGFPEQQGVSPGPCDSIDPDLPWFTRRSVWGPQTPQVGAIHDMCS